MSSATIPMRDEFSRLSILRRETTFDWTIHPLFGFFSENGYYLNQTGYYDRIKILVGGEYCQINYVSLFNDHVIRCPSILILAILGIIIGSVGFLKFRKFSARLSLSFIFFMFMNISGIFYHCLLPLSSKFRIFFAFTDKASTGVSGTFLSLELLSMLSSNLNVKRKDFSITQILYLVSIVFVEFLFSNIAIVAEYIYVFGCVSVFAVFQYIFIKGNCDEHLTKMSKYCLVLVGVLIIKLPFSASICQATWSVVNLMSMLFGISDIAFVIVLYYALKYFENHQNDKKIK